MLVGLFEAAHLVAFSGKAFDCLDAFDALSKDFDHGVIKLAIAQIRRAQPA